MDYYGYKLVMICTKQGIPLIYDLVAANTDERVAAETVIFHGASAKKILRMHQNHPTYYNSKITIQY